MFLYARWIDLPLPSRAAIARKFDIPKTGPTHVVSNVVRDDGYSISDIESRLSPEALRSFLGTDETDLSVLWDMLVTRMFGSGAVNPLPILEIAPQEVQEQPRAVPKVVAAAKKAAVKAVKKAVAKKSPKKAGNGKGA